MNKVKSFFGVSMDRVMILGLALSLTACVDQVPLSPNSLEGQSTYGENKLGDEQLPVVDLETYQLGIDYDDDDE